MRGRLRRRRRRHGALAVALAHALDGDVVNGDALQFYRGMDIGTAKVTEADPHRLISLLFEGASQRIRLASQIGSGLTGVLYVLDEPSIGLHQRDNDRLIAEVTTSHVPAG